MYLLALLRRLSAGKSITSQTYIFNNTYFNYVSLIPKYEDKVMFFLVLNLDLSVGEIKDVIDGKNYGDDGFLNRKTVFKLEDYK